MLQLMLPHYCVDGALRITCEPALRALLWPRVPPLLFEAALSVD